MSKLKIQKNKEKIVKLLNENIDLEYNLRLKTFKSFSQKVVATSKKDTTAVILKIGHWFEWFKDEDKPSEKGVKIERTEIIEIDGFKSNHWNRLKYYTINDF